MSKDRNRYKQHASLTRCVHQNQINTLSRNKLKEYK